MTARHAAAILLAVALSACGGGQVVVTLGTVPPGPPTAVAVASGDAAVALSWSPPAPSAGGAPASYRIDITPAAPQATVTTNGTVAVIAGLTSGVPYDFAVGAVNAAGVGPWSASVRAAPSAADPAAYAPLAISGDAGAQSGAFDPSVVAVPGGAAWLAYSSVHYYANAASQIVKDVSTSVAKSVDGGRTYAYVRTVGAAQGPVVVSDPTSQVCGQAACAGRWIYEVPFLVRDAADPDPARAWKLFAHKYFLYPPAANSNIHVLGAIVMWTAAAPDGAWSAESTVLRWASTPPEIVGGTRLDSLDASLAPCLLVTEGSGSATPDGIDFAFTCMFASGSGFAGKTVLLRSADHAASVRYVSTLTTPADAVIRPGAGFFNAPALKPSADGVPMLVVTPDNGTGTYLGCVAIPFADRRAGTLVRDARGLPVPILTVSPAGGRFAGACAWDGAAGGILMDDLDTTLAAPFRIVVTGKAL